MKYIYAIQDTKVSVTNIHERLSVISMISAGYVNNDDVTYIDEIVINYCKIINKNTNSINNYQENVIFILIS